MLFIRQTYTPLNFYTIHAFRFCDKYVVWKCAKFNPALQIDPHSKLVFASPMRGLICYDTLFRFSMTNLSIRNENSNKIPLAPWFLAISRRALVDLTSCAKQLPLLHSPPWRLKLMRWRGIHNLRGPRREGGSKKWCKNWTVHFTHDHTSHIFLKEVQYQKIGTHGFLNEANIHW